MKRHCIWIVILAFCFATCVPVAVALAADQKEITVTGVIKKTKRMTYVTKNNEKYRLIGQNFSQLIGKKLRVTGKLTEGHSGKTLLVTYMEYVRN